MAIVLISAMITILAFSFINDPGLQTVDVAGLGFRIPAEFEENISSFSAEDDNGIITISKIWESSTDFIKITVMYSNGTYIDANEVNDKIGGHKQIMFGYSGFLHKSHGIYSFSFVKKNMLVTIYTSNHNLFDEIAVL